MLNGSPSLEINDNKKSGLIKRAAVLYKTAALAYILYLSLHFHAQRVRIVVALVFGNVIKTFKILFNKQV